MLLASLCISSLLFLILPITFSQKADDQQQSSSHLPSSPCRLYLSDSSIPNSGLGIYSGIALPKGSIATDEDIPIQICDFKANQGHNTPWLAEHYWWEVSTTSGQHYANACDTLIPSFGMLANSHLSLCNVEQEQFTRDDIGALQRNIHPGAGAVSDSQTMTYRTTEDIQAGEEIFVDYGQNYFFHREKDWGVTISTVQDFEKADAAAKEFHRALVADPSCDSSSPTIKSLWDVVRSVASPRTRAALPEIEHLDKAAERGTARVPLNNDIRSIEWLEENAMCLDNLSSKPSTIDGAGRGAFATRFIPKGKVVAPMPVIQLERRLFDLYEMIPPENMVNYPKKKENATVIGQQLLLNYCFGHKDSNILLFPYSVAVQFINHHQEPNAELRWSTSFNNYDWLETPTGELLNMTHAGLVFEIVATKDIPQGGEVFLDYGRDWEMAWKRHVEEWNPIFGAEDHIHWEDANKDLSPPFRTVEEQINEPYASNIQTACKYYLPDLSVDLDEEREIARNNGHGNRLVINWEYKGEYEFKYTRPCTILERVAPEEEGGQFMYHVRMENHGHNEDNDIIPTGEEHIVENVYHEAISFIERPYSNNQFIPNAFRHEIGIPDKIFPKAWLNNDAGGGADNQ